MAGDNTVTVELHDIEGMVFEVDFAGGHEMTLDADEEAGGRNQGPRPMALLLAGLGGCTGMDVISLLRKMRQPVAAYRVEVTGERAPDHPKVYTHITVRHIVAGEVNEERLAHAIELSTTRYCSAIAMLGQAAQITTEYEILSG